MPRCPVCKLQTDLIRYEGLPVYNCGGCGGYWLTQARFDAILARREVQMPPAVQQKMIEIAEASESRETIWCMTCGRAMVKQAFKHWPEIRIDRCERCGGIWLDRGELEKCQVYWEYLQDNPDSEAGERAERMGRLESRWAARKAELEEQAERIEDPRLRHHAAVNWLWDLLQGPDG